MEAMKVRDLMVPVNKFVCIPEDASLGDAIHALMKARRKCDSDSFEYRSILVCTREGIVLGKLSLLDVLRSLEPRYIELGDFKRFTGCAYTFEFIQTMMKEHGIWQAPLSELCRKSDEIKVGTIVSAPMDGEIIDENVTLDYALHQLIIGHFQVLLVRSGECFIGLLRLTDVFEEVARRVELCSTD